MLLRLRDSHSNAKDAESVQLLTHCMPLPLAVSFRIPTQSLRSLSSHILRTPRQTTMPHLPPEVLAPIFEHSLPPPSFDSFSERSSNLRAFALVCRGWTSEAQRLLLQAPVIYLTSNYADDFNAEKADEIFQSVRKLVVGRGVQMRELRSRGMFTSPDGMATLLRLGNMAQLTSLSLSATYFDFALLRHVPSELLCHLDCVAGGGC